MKNYPTTHQELWSRLLQFRFDEPGISLPFSRRLARENSWSQGYTARVLEEYRRFIFLAMTAGHPVTPSVDVDQAWHLHLTYTRSYWDDLCLNVLREPLHHQPTKGGNKEGAKFEDWYARTLQSYQTAFGAPPPTDIWPPPKIRLATESRIRQVSNRTHWVIRKPNVSMVGIVAAVAILGLLLTGCDGGSLALILGISIPVAVVIGVIMLIRKAQNQQGGEQQNTSTDGGHVMVGDTGSYWYTTTETDTGSGMDADTSGNGSNQSDGSDSGNSWGGSDSSDSSSSDSSSSGDSGCSGCGGCGGGD